jgi:hypothetical protein
VFFPIKSIKSHQKSNNLPPVSIIICAKNEAQNLDKLLPKLLEQNYPAYEILVVNDESTDQTEKIIQKWKKQSDKIRIINFSRDDNSKGKKAPLSFGIEHAKYEQLLFTDADCLPTSDFWIALMMQADSKLDNPDITLGIGDYKTNTKALSKFIQMDTIMIYLQYIGWAKMGYPYMSVGRNVAYKKSIWKSVNGFETHKEIPSGDDDLFIQSIANNNLTIGLQVHPDAHTISHPKNNFKDWTKQKIRHHSTGFKYRFSDIFRLAFFQIAILIFYSGATLNLLHNNHLTIISTIILLKFFVQFVLFNAIFKKLRITQNPLLFLVFELLWVILNVYWSFCQLLTNKKTW